VSGERACCIEAMRQSGSTNPGASSMRHRREAAEQGLETVCLPCRAAHHPRTIHSQDTHQGQSETVSGVCGSSRMDANRDSARQALALARAALDAGELDKAERLAAKANRLYASFEVRASLPSGR
jgi:hypothetical protein